MSKPTFPSVVPATATSARSPNVSTDRTPFSSDIDSVPTRRFRASAGRTPPEWKRRPSREKLSAPSVS